MLLFSGVTNLGSLAAMFIEFDVAWVKEKIKDYLEKIEQNTTQSLLLDLDIASKMEFVQAETNLINQLDESFIFIQMYPEFSALDTKTKILVARKRLWFLMDFLDNKTKDLLLNNESAGLLSILINYNQKPIRFFEKVIEIKLKTAYQMQHRER